jgi:hypothetical protein
MDEEFLAASQPPPSFSGIYEGEIPPFDFFEIPEMLSVFFDSLTRGRGYNLGHAMLYGGAITDQYLGRAPKDYDLYLHCPKMVEDIQGLLATKVSSYRDMNDRDDSLDSILGAVPLVYNEGVSSSRRVRINRPLDNVSIAGSFHHDGDIYNMDIRVCSTLITPRFLSSVTAAPAVSGVVKVHDGTVTYAYHENFKEHLDRKILLPARPHNDEQMFYLMQLAKKKDFTLVRGADIAPLSPKP